LRLPEETPATVAGVTDEYLDVLDDVESLAESRVGHGQQIEFVRMASALEIVPIRTDLARVAVFASPGLIEILVGSVVHESFTIDPRDSLKTRQSCFEIVEAALDGKLVERLWFRRQRMIYGLATLQVDDKCYTYHSGLSLLRGLARTETRTYEAYPMVT